MSGSSGEGMDRRAFVIAGLAATLTPATASGLEEVEYGLAP